MLCFNSFLLKVTELLVVKYTKKFLKKILSPKRILSIVRRKLSDWYLKTWPGKCSAFTTGIHFTGNYFFYFSPWLFKNIYLKLRGTSKSQNEELLTNCIALCEMK